MINQHWNRWILASASVAFQDALALTNDPPSFVVEGQPTKLKADYIEFRMNGPTWYQSSRTVYLGDVIINLLVRASLDETDFHRIFKLVGNAEAIFVPCFSIRKYGNTPGVDDKSVIIGSMYLQRMGDQDLETIHYGQIAPDLPMLESTVQGNYRAEIQITTP